MLLDHKGDKSCIGQLESLQERLESAVKKCVELEIRASRRNVEEDSGGTS